MEVRIIKEEEKKLVIEFIDKDKHTIPQLVTSELNKDKRVNLASYRIDHPLKDRVEIVITVNEGDPKEILKEALERLYNKIREFREAWSKRE